MSTIFQILSTLSKSKSSTPDLSEFTFATRVAGETGNWTTSEDRFVLLNKQQQVEWLSAWFSHTLATHPILNTNFFRLTTNDRCRDRHNILEPEMLEISCPLDNGRHDMDQSVVLLSTFNQKHIPREIIERILLDHLDLASLTTLRRVSRGMRYLIDRFPRYKTIFQHAPSTLRAMLCLGVARYFTCNDLYQAFCSEACTTCGQFGAMLYVLKCSRTCYTCLANGDRTLPVQVSNAKLLCAISSKDISEAKIPIARVIPGRYSKGIKRITSRNTYLVDHYTSGLIGVQKHGSREEMTRVVAKINDEKENDWRIKDNAWANTPVSKRFARPPAYPHPGDRFDGKEHNMYRFACSVGMPSFNKESKTVNWGIACNHCDISRYRKALNGTEWELACAKSGILYSRSGFIAHFIECEDSQKVVRKFLSALVDGEKHFAYHRGICRIAGDFSVGGSLDSHIFTTCEYDEDD